LVQRRERKRRRRRRKKPPPHSPRESWERGREKGGGESRASTPPFHSKPEKWGGGKKEIKRQRKWYGVILPLDFYLSLGEAAQREERGGKGEETSPYIVLEGVHGGTKKRKKRRRDRRDALACTSQVKGGRVVKAGKKEKKKRKSVSVPFAEFARHVS